MLRLCIKSIKGQGLLQQRAQLRKLKVMTIILKPIFSDACGMSKAAFGPTMPIILVKSSSGS